MRFLGTGAAEMIPCPFCSCPICEHTRRHPQEARVRSSFCYDAHTLIDCGPDTMAACQRYNVRLQDLTDILFTHLHGDHFSEINLDVITMSRTSKGKPYTAHMSREGLRYLHLRRDALLQATGGKKDLFADIENGWFSLEGHDAFETFHLGDKTVFTVRGNHQGEAPDERSLHYRITESGKTLLYALDGGLYEPESLEALSGTPLDILIMDATFGSAPQPLTGGHLNGEHFLMQLESLSNVGAVTAATRVYATHINHYGVWTHGDYQQFFIDHGATNVTVASDGLEISF